MTTRLTNSVTLAGSSTELLEMIVLGTVPRSPAITSAAMELLTLESSATMGTARMARRATLAGPIANGQHAAVAMVLLSEFSL